jgi:hypothetical protein
MEGTLVGMRGDSVEYKLLEQWVKGLTPQDFYLTAEIGVREGYGTLIITDALKLKNKNYFHIGIDPYGDLLYKHLDKQIDYEKGTVAYWTDFEGKPMVNEDGTPKVPTYPNSMKQTFLSEFKNHENFILYQLEDTEYFNAFGGGVPVYQNGKKQIVNCYDFVHFDGPHTTEKVLEEVMFFAPRSRVGTRFVFDDSKTYEMSKIAHALTYFGFYTQEMGNDKCMLEKTR